MEYKKPNTKIVIKDEIMTKQSFRDEVDINQIVGKYYKTGMITHINENQPMFADVSEIRDYKQSLDLIQNAQNLFNGLPSEIRERFDNDPGKMIDFLDDQKKQKRGRRNRTYNKTNGNGTYGAENGKQGRRDGCP